MNNLQKKFYRFKSGVWGRIIDITLGIILIGLGVLLASFIKWVIILIGIFALTAGVFNVCWLSPVIGIPFSGRKKIS